jgi:hypothetical protein
MSNLASMREDHAGRDFLQKVNKMVVSNKGGLPAHKFMALFVFSNMLGESDSKECLVMWKTWIALQRQRQELVISSTKREIALDQRNALMPETMAPYAMYLLVNHSEAPTDPQSPNMYKFGSCLKFIFETLVATMGGDADNVAYLIAMVNQISESSVVALPANGNESTEALEQKKVPPSFSLPHLIVFLHSHFSPCCSRLTFF